jgi:hypothetical protein
MQSDFSRSVPVRYCETAVPLRTVGHGQRPHPAEHPGDIGVKAPSAAGVPFGPVSVAVAVVAIVAVVTGTSPGVRTNALRLAGITPDRLD